MSNSVNFKASIVAISYDPTAQTLNQQLAALTQQDFGDFEYVLVDSGKRKLSSKVLNNSQLASQTSTTTIPLPSTSAKGFNYATAYNTGIKRARGQIVVRLSADAIPTNTAWLRYLLEPFGKNNQKNPKIGIVFGRFKNASGSSRPTATALGQGQVETLSHKPYHWYETLWRKITQPSTPRTHRHFPFVTGACFALKRSLWRAHPFNPTWRWGEEYEFANYVQKQGFSIHYTPRVVTFHSHSLGFIPGLKRILRDARLAGQVMLLWALGKTPSNQGLK